MSLSHSPLNKIQGGVIFLSENTISDAQREAFRFPCEQREYVKTVGELLLTILSEMLIELGFKVIVPPQRANGVDMKIFQGDDLVAVAEVLNWRTTSRLSDKRRHNIIRNLNEYDCCKLLIHTVPLSNLDGFGENGIYLLQIGYQVLPESYYDFFLTREQVERRDIDSNSTRRNIRSKILDYINNHLFAHKYLKFLMP